MKYTGPSYTDYFILFIGWQVGSTSMSASPPHTQPTQRLQMGPVGQLCCQNAFRRVSVQSVTASPKLGRLVKKLRKQVLSCELRPKCGSFM
jgi:hypothetical protein